MAEHLRPAGAVLGRERSSRPPNLSSVICGLNQIRKWHKTHSDAKKLQLSRRISDQPMFSKAPLMKTCIQRMKGRDKCVSLNVVSVSHMQDWQD